MGMDNCCTCEEYGGDPYRPVVGDWYQHGWCRFDIVSGVNVGPLAHIRFETKTMEWSMPASTQTVAVDPPEYCYTHSKYIVSRRYESTAGSMTGTVTIDRATGLFSISMTGVPTYTVDVTDIHDDATEHSPITYTVTTRVTNLLSTLPTVVKSRVLSYPSGTFSEDGESITATWTESDYLPTPVTCTLTYALADEVRFDTTAQASLETRMTDAFDNNKDDILGTRDGAYFGTFLHSEFDGSAPYESWTYAPTGDSSWPARYTGFNWLWAWPVSINWSPMTTPPSFSEVVDDRWAGEWEGWQEIGMTGGFAVEYLYENLHKVDPDNASNILAEPQPFAENLAVNNSTFTYTICEYVKPSTLVVYTDTVKTAVAVLNTDYSIDVDADKKIGIKKLNAVMASTVTVEYSAFDPSMCPSPSARSSDYAIVSGGPNRVKVSDAYIAGPPGVNDWVHHIKKQNRLTISGTTVPYSSVTYVTTYEAGDTTVGDVDGYVWTKFKASMPIADETDIYIIEGDLGALWFWDTVGTNIGGEHGDCPCAVSPSPPIQPWEAWPW